MRILKKPEMISLLLTIYFIIFFYSHNIREIYFREFGIMLIIALGGTLLLLLFLIFVLKNRQKASYFMALIVVVFYFYGHVYNLINGLEIARPRYLLPITGFIFICCAYFIFRTKRGFRNLTVSLNITAVSLIALALLNIGYHVMIKMTNTNNLNKNEARKPSAVGSTNKEFLRDIYYIILDEYANFSTLKDLYDYDNREFADYLSGKGFYIASKSFSNYSLTFNSLASSLNMRYLDDQFLRSGKPLLKDHEIRRFIKAKGYMYININSNWFHTKQNEFADLNIQTGKWNSNFMEMIKTTILFHFLRGFMQTSNRHAILAAFNELAEIPKIKGPKFVFAHITCPHPPFLFDSDGKIVPAAMFMRLANAWWNKKYYLNQLIFINKKVQILIDEILRKSEVQPIIVLQADHGPESTLVTEKNHGWDNPSLKGLRERMRIFNAYYLPPSNSLLLYISISPVNTFRLIFDAYFNSNYGLLEDRSYFSTVKQPNHFTDVTSQVIFD